MSAPTQSDRELSRREEMSVSGADMSAAPWTAATATGGVVAGGDLILHLIGPGSGLSALRCHRARALGADRGGIIDPVLSGLWHGGLVYGLTGVAGVVSKSRQRPT